MVDKLKNISSRRIIAGTAIALVLLFVAGGMFAFVTESSARKNGSLSTQVMQAEDFAWSGIAVKDGVTITTDNDPQMIMEYSGRLTSIKFYMEYSIYPGEMCIYYKNSDVPEYSATKRLWITPVQGQPGWYTMETSMLDVATIRIDPTMYAGNILEFGDFIFNEEKSFADYFTVSYGDIFNLILYTGVVSSVLKFLQEMLKKQFD